MNYRDMAIAVETEARVSGTQAILQGIYSKFDEMITSRSNRPWSIAWWIFDQGSDRQARQLAALWLWRHDRDQGDYFEPEVNPVLGTMLDQALESMYQKGKQDAREGVK